MELADEIIEKMGPGLTMELWWISGHSGVVGNELVDEEAKRGSQGDSSEARLLPPFLTDHVLGHSIVALK
jgi:ribonuclease HI